MPPLDTRELVADIAAVEDEVTRVRARLEDAETQLESLEQQKAEAAGAAVLARRALEDLERRLGEHRAALSAVERVETLVAERDATAVAAARLLDEALARLDALAAARGAVEAALEQVRRGLGGARPPLTIPPEPAELVDAWNRLVGRVRSHIDERLDDELVDVAARSPLGAAIDDLPRHLRALAQERRRRWVAEAREGERS
jgi:hypothetical protein